MKENPIDACYQAGYNAGKADEHPKPPDKQNMPQHFTAYYRGYTDGKCVRAKIKDSESRDILKSILG